MSKQRNLFSYGHFFIFIIFLLSLTLFTHLIKIENLQATEVDNYTAVTKNLHDSLEWLNHTTQEKLNKAMMKANSSRKRCDQKKLFAEIWKELGGDFWGQLENDIEKEKSLSKFSPSRRQSVYRRFKVSESFPLYMVKLGSTVKVGNYYLGSDKFGHFFAEGYAYYKKAFKQKKGIRAGMRYGEKTERGFFGLKTTAVYSYGDLTANFNGMFFWNNVINSQNIHQADEQHYFTCNENGLWETNRLFDWSDYIDGAWDETINCSKLRTKKLQHKVDRQVSRLEEKSGLTHLNCPRLPEECAKAVEKYGIYAEKLIHPLCRKAAEEFISQQEKVCVEE